MNCKLIACDLDGTLLNSDGCVSEENLDAIGELAKREILFVPATGRSLNEIPESIRKNPSIRYIISSNGAVINDLQTGKSETFLIDGAVVSEFYKRLKKYDFLFVNHKSGYSLTDINTINDDTMDEYNIGPYFRNQLRYCTKRIENFDEEFIHEEPCEMLSGCFKEVSDAYAFRSQILKDHPDLYCTVSVVGTLEIVDARAGKHNAIKFLIDRLGISKDDIITVGDTLNDVEMIEFAPNSIAMSNACDILKSKASHIACDNNSSIVRYIIDNFII